jgi:hypothetical protein
VTDIDQMATKALGGQAVLRLRLKLPPRQNSAGRGGARRPPGAGVSVTLWLEPHEAIFVDGAWPPTA